MPYVLLTYIIAVAIVALLFSLETPFGLGLGIVLLACLGFGLIGLRRQVRRDVDAGDRPVGPPDRVRRAEPPSKRARDVADWRTYASTAHRREVTHEEPGARP